MMNNQRIVYVGIDIAKVKNDVLVEYPNGDRKRMKVLNRLDDFQAFVSYLQSFDGPCQIGLEATGNYHRAIAYFLEKNNFRVNLISSVALSRTREALHNSWDKNDPKDAQVMIHMLKAGVQQVYFDPVHHGFNDHQELSKTHFEISREKTKVQHSILTHYLPLYFPEAEKYFYSSRAEWFSTMLYHFPCPNSIQKLSKEEFVEKAWDLAGRKVSKRAFLEDFYNTACRSIAIPVEEDSSAIAMFRLILQQHIHLCRKRQEIEDQAHEKLKGDHRYQLLRSLPGVGPIIALTILAETGDFKRFKHHRQYLKFCGFDLSTHQSGQFRGQSKLSKRGNRYLRCAFWMAATIAIRMRENTFRRKYHRYIRKDPDNSDLKRKAYTAAAVKMARVVYGMMRSESVYRPYFEEAIPSGRIPSVAAVEA